MPPLIQGPSKMDPYMGLCLQRRCSTPPSTPPTCTGVTDATNAPPFFWRKRGGNGVGAAGAIVASTASIAAASAAAVITVTAELGAVGNNAAAAG